MPEEENDPIVEAAARFAKENPQRFEGVPPVQPAPVDMSWNFQIIPASRRNRETGETTQVNLINAIIGTPVGTFTLILDADDWQGIANTLLNVVQQAKSGLIVPTDGHFRPLGE